MRTKNIVYLPEENLVLNFEVTKDKPFNKCFKCRSFRNGCSGPNLTVMQDFERVCEFLQMTRIFLGYSYQQVADGTTKNGTSVSLATVKRLLTGKISNPDYLTVAAVSRFLLGDPNGKFPCAIPDVALDPDNEQKLNSALLELERAMNDNKDYRQLLDSIHTSYNAEMQIIRDEAKSKIDHLLQQVEHLKTENTNLWAENNRKAKMIDMFIESQQGKRDK
jgi:transcriptional regulator with XRE-family HTH domain